MDIQAIDESSYASSKHGKQIKKKRKEDEERLHAHHVCFPRLSIARDDSILVSWARRNKCASV